MYSNMYIYIYSIFTLTFTPIFEPIENVWKNTLGLDMNTA